MDQISTIVGIVSGLVAIFTFTTGVGSLAELRRSRRSARLGPPSSATSPTAPSRPGDRPTANRATMPTTTPTTTPTTASPSARSAMIRLVILAPIFVVSIFVTAQAGLAGSDTGGIVALLLGAAALAVFAYQFWFHRSLPRSTYGMVTAAILALLGRTFGSIGRGEEEFGLTAGIVIGVGAWLIIALSSRIERRDRETADGRDPTRDQDEGPDVSSTGPGDPLQERTILEIAAEAGGRVTAIGVALQSDISLDEAARLLEGLAERGFCQQLAQSSGTVQYRFPEFEDAGPRGES
jgi:hypothetical protein